MKRFDAESARRDGRGGGLKTSAAVCPPRVRAGKKAATTPG
jgi:hypothetical protein